MRCKYDRDAKEYLVDGAPCRHDEYGDPTYHCTARRTCSNHVGPRELTCHGCITSARSALDRILDLLALVDTEAYEADRVDREVVTLAGPIAHPVKHWWRRINERRQLDLSLATGDLTGEAWGRLDLALRADDEHTAETLITTWHAMLAEDWGHELPERMGVGSSADYLDRHLARIAQDEHQDFPLLLRELRSAASSLEVAVRDSTQPERGVPCPECVADRVDAPRLIRHYGHWCDPEQNPDCDKMHYVDDSGDVWRCPKNHRHEWTHRAYSDYLTERSA